MVLPAHDEPGQEANPGGMTPPPFTSRLRMARLHDQRQAAGLCIRCGQPNAARTRHCDACLRKVRRAMKIKKAARRARKECPVCGAVKAKGSVLCERHRDQQRESSRQRKRKTNRRWRTLRT